MTYLVLYKIDDIKKVATIEQIDADSMIDAINECEKLGINTAQILAITRIEE